MVEVGQVNHARAGSPGPLQEAGGGGRLWAALLGQLVVEIQLEGLAEAIDRRAPLGLVAPFGQKALNRYTLGGLLERKCYGRAVGEAYRRRTIVGAKPGAQLAAGPV